MKLWSFLNKSLQGYFGLDYGVEFPLPETRVEEDDLNEMLLEKGDPSKDLSKHKGSIWSRTRTDFNHAYSNLSFVMMKDFEAKTGSFNCLSRERLSLMYAVHTDEKVDWCTYIFRNWGNMINKFRFQEKEGWFSPKESVGVGLRICFMLRTKFDFDGAKCKKVFYLGEIDNLKPKGKGKAGNAKEAEIPKEKGAGKRKSSKTTIPAKKATKVVVEEEVSSEHTISARNEPVSETVLIESVSPVVKSKLKERKLKLKAKKLKLKKRKLMKDGKLVRSKKVPADQRLLIEIF